MKTSRIELERSTYIDEITYDEMCGTKLTIPVCMDPQLHEDQAKHTGQLPWLYRARSSIVYTEDLDPEKRIRQAYLKRIKEEESTVLFHPYKKPFTSPVIQKSLYEDPSDPRLATLKYVREKPLNFVIFGKPGVNVETLGREVAEYWNCVYVDPVTAVRDSSDMNVALEKKLRKGDRLNIVDVMSDIRSIVNGVESRKRGYVLTGIPLRQHYKSDFHVFEQMECIFQSSSRPDIVIYATCPTPDALKLCSELHTKDLVSGYMYNTRQLEDFRDLPVKEDDHYEYLKKDFETLMEKDKRGCMVQEKLFEDADRLVDDYAKKLLPIIDSYVLEYDSQCIIKVDGRCPVSKMLHVVTERLETLPFYPKCTPKAVFPTDTEVEATPRFFQDNRSLDSIAEDQFEEPEDQEEEVVEEKRDEEEEEPEKVEEKKEEIEQQLKPEQLDSFEPLYALEKLKDYNKIDPNFKWQNSEFDMYCPVGTDRGQVLIGLPKYACTYLGRIYCSATEEFQREFLLNPNKFITPRPTFKIFILGPPSSGQGDLVTLFANFFQIKVIYMRDVIEKIFKRSYDDICIEIFTKKIHEIMKIQKVEDSIFDQKELVRAKDVVDWMKEQIPIIKERTKYSSIIFPMLDQEQESFHEQEEQEIYKAEEEIPFEIPDVDIDKIIKEVLDPQHPVNISDRYIIDFPPTSAMKKIYMNPVEDEGMLRKGSFGTMDRTLNSLQQEFETRGLKCFNDLEECRRILLNPKLLFKYIPVEMKRPYSERVVVSFDDPRVESEDNQGGLRTAFGFIPVDPEILADALEEEILECEAEINLQNDCDENEIDLRIGGWIVDSVPIDEKLWDILAERYLLPDDVICRGTDPNHQKRVVENFCSVIKSMDIHPSVATVPKPEQLDTSDSVPDLVQNKLVETRNSFIAVNEHYTAMLDQKKRDELKTKKVCHPEPEDVKKSDVKNSNVFKGMKGFNVKYADDLLYKLDNPFDIVVSRRERKLPLSDVWRDDVLLDFFEEFTKHKLRSTYQNFNVSYGDDVYIPVSIDKPQIISSLLKERQVFRSKCRRSSLKKHKEDEEEEDESFSSTTTDESVEPEDFCKDRCDNDWCMNKETLKDLGYYKFQEHLIRTDKWKRELKIRELEMSSFEIFEHEVLGVTENLPPKVQLEFLSEVRYMLSMGASLTEITETLSKFMRKGRLIERYISEDNINIPIPPADQAILEKQAKLTRGTNISDIFSEQQVTPLRYTKEMTSLGIASVISFDSAQLHPLPATHSLRRISSPDIIDGSEVSPDSQVVVIKDWSEELQTSSEILAMDSLPSLLNIVSSRISLPPSRKNSVLLLPAISKSAVLEEKVEEVKGRCSCCKTVTEKCDYCTCDTSSTEINIKRNRKKLCIWDSSSEEIAPWEPKKGFLPPIVQKDSEIAFRKQISTLRLHPVYSDKQPEHKTKKVLKPEGPGVDPEPGDGEKPEQVLYDDVEKLEVNEDDEAVEPGENKILEESEQSQEVVANSQDVKDEPLVGGDMFDDVINMLLEGIQESEVETQTLELLAHENAYESDMSIVYATSSKDMLKWKKRQDWPDPLPVTSTERFEPSLTQISTSSTSLAKDFANFLLPDLTATEWEKFVNFVNSIYLSVATLQELGYASITSSIGSFYLECCPSSSRENLDEYMNRPDPDPEPFSMKSSSESLFTKEEIKAIAKEFMDRLYGPLPDNYEEPRDSASEEVVEEDDLCVLEVCLPLPEEKFNTALNTAVKCLIRDKTIDELFAGDDHEMGRKTRLSSFTLQTIAQSAEIKEFKKGSFLEQEESIEVDINEVRSDASFEDVSVPSTELLEPRQSRFGSIDERYRPSCEFLHDEDESSDEDEVLPEEIRMTIPRALLYVPYVMPRRKKITNKTKVNLEHLKKYYSLQSQCKLEYSEEERGLKFKYVLKTKPGWKSSSNEDVEPEEKEHVKVHKEEEDSQVHTRESVEPKEQIHEDVEPKEEDEENIVNEEGLRKVVFCKSLNVLQTIFKELYKIHVQKSKYSEDLDEELREALVRTDNTPEKFYKFLQCLDYNVRRWLKEWESFNKTILLKSRFFQVMDEFVPFYEDLEKRADDLLSRYIHIYEQYAFPFVEEAVVRKTNQEILQNELEPLKDEDKVEKVEEEEVELSDFEIPEILPDEYSDFYYYCPVIYTEEGEAMPTNCEKRAIFQDQVYCFSSDEAVQKFEKAPSRYATSNTNYPALPVRISMVVSGDYNGGHIGRKISDAFGVPYVSLWNELKRIKGHVEYPVGIFFEDPVNVDNFITQTSPAILEDDLKTNEWNHFRDYSNLTSSLKESELETIIDPLWKTEFGVMFYSLPHNSQDLDYMIKRKRVPDVIVMVDSSQERNVNKDYYMKKILARQELNFGARLKRLLSKDHRNLQSWLAVRPKIFNILLRQFLRDRRKEKIKNRQKPPEEPKEAPQEQSSDLWDVEWLLYQVGDEQHEKAVDKAFELHKAMKCTNVLDDPLVTPEIKQEFVEYLKPKEPIQETQSKTKVSKKKKSVTEARQPDQAEEHEISEQPEHMTPDESSASFSSDYHNETIERRDVALLNLMEETGSRKYLPKFTPVNYRLSIESFDMDTSLTSLIGLEGTDSIQSREITSSLSLIGFNNHDTKERLINLIYGEKPILRSHMEKIVKEFKEAYPCPRTNIRKLARVSLKHSKQHMENYFKLEAEHFKKMKQTCQEGNIPWIEYKSSDPVEGLIQEIKNVIRKPDFLDRVFVINYQTAVKLIKNGFYYLSRFGHWCPVQVYERSNPIQFKVNWKVMQTIIIPVIHKKYIYFIYSRESLMKFMESPLKYIKQDTLLTVFPVKIAIIGPPMSGKSLIAKSLSKIYNLKIVTLEKAMEYLMAYLYWTDLAKSIKNSIKNGKVLPSEYNVKILEAYLSTPNALNRGWILDCFPSCIEDIEEMKRCDIVPQVIFSFEADNKYYSTEIEELDEKVEAVQEKLYFNNEFIGDMEDNDFENEVIKHEMRRMLPPKEIIYLQMGNWHDNVKSYQNMLESLEETWGNVHKVDINKPDLLAYTNEVLTIYLWALQDYNINMNKGLPVPLHLITVSETEFQLHKSPFQDCCPGCWFYFKIYFRCPTCKFRDMRPGLIQYENFFYWVCLTHYNAFLCNPAKFIMSYNANYLKRYPEKASVGESVIRDILTVKNGGHCVTCYYNNLPNLVYIKGIGKFAVLLEKKYAYLFCSEKCVCEMLMAPAKYMTIEIEYKKKKKLPPLRKLQGKNPCALFEQIVSDAIFESLKKFIVQKPKIFNLSHKVSACTILAAHLKLKSKISKRELAYFKDRMEFLEKHCKKLDIWCKNINKIASFLGPLSQLEYSRSTEVSKQMHYKILESILPLCDN